MIFYIATDKDGRKHVLTVHGEALKIDKHCVEIDQPNDKASLKQLIQESFDEIFKLQTTIDLLQIGSEEASSPAVGSDGSQEQVASGETSRPQAEPSVRPTYMDTFNAAKMAERQTQPKTDEIVDFIFDHASNNQVATIFSAIGTRFSELAKENEKLTAA